MPALTRTQQDLYKQWRQRNGIFDQEVWTERSLVKPLLVVHDTSCLWNVQARNVSHAKQPIVVAQVGEGYSTEDRDHLSVEKVCVHRCSECCESLNNEARIITVLQIHSAAVLSVPNRQIKPHRVHGFTQSPPSTAACLGTTHTHTVL